MYELVPAGGVVISVYVPAWGFLSMWNLVSSRLLSVQVSLI